MVLRRYGAVIASVILVAGALSVLSCAPPPHALASSSDALAGPETTEEPAAEPLFPVKQNDKWGYIDRNGTIVIKPQFGFADGFQDGLARINVGGDWFLADYGDGGKWGYIDRSGEVVIKAQFDQAEPFCEGMAWVCIGDDETAKVGFINRTGEFAFTENENLQFERYDCFSEGLLPAYVDGTCAYVDTNGKAVFFCPRFLSTDTFSEGFARVTLDRLVPGRTHGYIDTSGHVVIRPRFNYASWFSEGLAAVLVGRQNQDGKYGYIDKKGNWVIRPKFQLAEAFSEGLAVIWGGDDEKCGYIDRTGKIVIEQRFDWAMGFSEGLAAVEVDEKWGFVDKTGHVLVEPRYDDVQDFSHGLAQVRLGNKIGYIDKTGEHVWELPE